MSEFHDALIFMKNHQPSQPVPVWVFIALATGVPEGWVRDDEAVKTRGERAAEAFVKVKGGWIHFEKLSPGDDICRIAIDSHYIEAVADSVRKRLAKIIDGAGKPDPINRASNVTNRAIIRISEELLIDVLCLPKNTLIQAADFDYNSMSIRLSISHPDLALVPPAAETPMAYPAVSRDASGAAKFAGWGQK